MSTARLVLAPLPGGEPLDWRHSERILGAAHRASIGIGPATLSCYRDPQLPSSQRVLTVRHDRITELVARLLDRLDTAPYDVVSLVVDGVEVDPLELVRTYAHALQSTRTCDHGRLLWQSCTPCGLKALAL